MKLHLNDVPGLNRITACGSGFVEVNGVRRGASIVVLPHRLIEGWKPPGDPALTSDDARALAGLDADVTLLGTGERLRFPAPAVRAALAGSRAPVEIMDTRAACRTYNILAAEGRRVAAALIVEGRAAVEDASGDPGG